MRQYQLQCIQCGCRIRKAAEYGGLFFGGVDGVVDGIVVGATVGGGLETEACVEDISVEYCGVG